MKAADVRRGLLNLRSRVQSFPPPFLLNVPGVVHGPYIIGRYHLDLNVGHSQKRPKKCGTFMVALGRCLHPHILNKSRGGKRGQPDHDLVVWAKLIQVVPFQLCPNSSHVTCMHVRTLCSYNFTNFSIDWDWGYYNMSTHFHPKISHKSPYPWGTFNQHQGNTGASSRNTSLVICF